MEITLVGIYAETSPACVSMIGSAVSCRRSGCSLHARADGSADRIRRPDKPHAWRTVKQKGKCTVSYRVLGQIVVNDQNVLALVHEEFTDRAAAYGAMYCSGADSDAVAATMQV